MLAHEDEKRIEHQPDSERASSDEIKEIEKDLTDDDATPPRRSSIFRAAEADRDHDLDASRTLSRSTSRPYTQASLDIERALSHGSRPNDPPIGLAPTRTRDGFIVVDWYSTDDPANPQNWSYAKKSFVTLQLCLYAFAAYGASSMYASSETGVMKEFHVGETPAALGLAIYVFGYGVGPLLFAPLSEIAAVGRNWVYAPTFFIFVILSIPTAVVDNYAGLLVLRFLTGFVSQTRPHSFARCKSLTAIFSFQAPT